MDQQTDYEDLDGLDRAAIDLADAFIGVSFGRLISLIGLASMLLTGVGYLAVAYFK